MSDYAAPKVAGTPVTFEVWQNDAMVESTVVALDADGNYKFEASLEGTVVIRVKASHWLAKKQNVDLADTVDADFTLINGDVNGDNKINVMDYANLKSTYNKTGVDGNAADLNGDGTINVLDYSILKKNYYVIGE